MAWHVPRLPHAHLADRARRTNGATQTFRRPSHATTPSGSATPSAPRDAAAPQNSSNSGVYVPPHAQPGRNGASVEGRYSRDQLTQLFKTQRDSDDISDDVGNLYLGNWEQQATNGASGASWGRKDDHGRDAQSGVAQCWDRDGSILPLSLSDMTDEEREVRLWCSLKTAKSADSLRFSCRRLTHR
jgi:PERQ amino acid-rich with GYF domain-containing protein